MICIYILSLIEDQERRKHVLDVKRRLHAKNIDCVIINAYSWKSHNIPELLHSRGFQYNAKMSKSQLACFLSHYHMWQIISNTKPDTYSIVLEDDMDLSDDFNADELEAAIRSIPTPHDAILLWKHPEQAHKQAHVKQVNPHFTEFYYSWGLAAYLFTPQFAKHLLNIRQIDMPVDEILLQKYYKYATTYVAIKQHFRNLGLLGNVDYGPYVFKSNIWN